ncbi:MAG: hypothetical protein ABI172_02400 [Ginsengibacter sp.]
MERRFDMTNFEQSLKDHADQFSIMPSNKVWHGIYNNLHPGSKWPSFAMGLVFLFTLVGVGHLNNNPKQVTTLTPETSTDASILHLDNNQVASKRKEVASSKNQEASSKDQVVSSKKQVESSNDQVAESRNQLASEIHDVSSSRNHISGIDKQQKESAIIVAGNFIKVKNLTNEVKSANELKVSNEAPIIKMNQKSFNKQIQLSSNNLNKEESLVEHNKLSPGRITADNPINLQMVNNNEWETNTKQPLTVKNSLNILEGRSLVDNQEKLLFSKIDSLQNPALGIIFPGSNEVNQIANYEIDGRNNLKEEINNIEVGINKPWLVESKRNKKVSWIFFITPEVSTVHFSGKAIQGPPSPNFPSVVLRPANMGNNMIYNARLGFETGTEMAFNFEGKWSVTAGASISYSGYNIISDPAHPAFAHLLLKDRSGSIFLRDYITHFGNGQSQAQTTLNNFNLQASIPVGLQYQVWGNKTVQINLASTIAPSFVINSNAYILSSDGRNYINDPDLMRKINIAGNFGSFISFKSKNIKWHIGPDVRYQILSTYQNIYPVREHLLDYGIRIGISK